MKLTEGQLRPLWRLLGEAWEAHCRETGERVSDSKAKTAWRGILLKRETGFESLTKVPRAGRHYVDFMAALEVVAANGIRWQMAKHGAEKRPYIHAIGELMLKYEIEYDYAESIVRRVLSLGDEAPVPSWEKMEAEQLAAILAAFKRTCAYKLQREARAA